MKRGSIAALACLLLTAAAYAQQAPPETKSPLQPDQSIFVIAVKSRLPQSRDTWMKLNPQMRNRMQTPPPPGTVPSNRSTLEGTRPERATLDRPASERATLDREEPTRRLMPPAAPELKQEIEEALLKQKRFKLAASPETADFILFADGNFMHYDAMSTPNGTTGVVMMGSNADSDLPLNKLARLGLGIIPAADYRAWQSDVTHLMHRALWQAEAWGELRRDERERSMHFVEPSPQQLMQQFHKWALNR